MMNFVLEQNSYTIFLKGMQNTILFLAEFWKKIPPNEPYRVVLADVRDKLYNTRERSRQLLADGASDFPEGATYTHVNQVLSIRESRSDDKRFSIYTGTKKLHLRAECREDRAAWMDALQVVKGMFPRMPNSEFMSPINDDVISTEKLRQRLQEEGVGESAIEGSEKIMRGEFASMQKKLVLLS